MHLTRMNSTFQKQIYNYSYFFKKNLLSRLSDMKSDRQYDKEILNKVFLFITNCTLFDDI